MISRYLIRDSLAYEKWYGYVHQRPDFVERGGAWSSCRNDRVTKTRVNPRPLRWFFDRAGASYTHVDFIDLSRAYRCGLLREREMIFSETGEDHFLFAERPAPVMPDESITMWSVSIAPASISGTSARMEVEV